MLEIRTADNRPFDLLPNTGINIERASSLFAIELPIEAYSYPIEIPASPNNKQLLGFPDMPESTVAMGAKIPVTLSVYGYNVIDGQMTIIRASSTRISVAIVGSNNVNAILDSSLKTIDYGTPITFAVTADIISEADAAAIATVDTYDYCFPPHSNPIYDTTIVVSSIVNSYNATSATYNANNPMVPFLYLLVVLQNIADAMNLGLVGSWTIDTEMKSLCIYNTWNIYSNNSSIDYRNHLPEMSVRELLVAIKNMFNLNMYIDTNNSTLVMDWKTVPNASTAQADWTNIAEPTWDIEPHKPANEGYTLTLGIDDSDDVSKFVTGSLNITSIKGTVATPATLPAIANIGDVWFVRTLQQWGINVATTVWRVIAHIGYARNFIIDDGAETINTDAGTLPMSFIVGIGADMLMPIALQTGNNVYNSSTVGGTNPFNLRLLFYRGIQDTSNIALPAPMASSNVYDYDGDTIADTALMWSGQYGLYERFFKDWLAMRATAKVVTFTLRLNAAQLSMVDTNKPVIIDRNLYLIEKLNIQASARGIGKCTARMIRI